MAAEASFFFGRNSLLKPVIYSYDEKPSVLHESFGCFQPGNRWPFKSCGAKIATTSPSGSGPRRLGSQHRLTSAPKHWPQIIAAYGADVLRTNSEQVLRSVRQLHMTWGAKPMRGHMSTAEHRYANLPKTPPIALIKFQFDNELAQKNYAYTYFSLPIDDPKLWVRSFCPQKLHFCPGGQRGKSSDTM